MPSLKEVKSRITSVISTQQITKAMKMVAAAKLRKSQDRITQMRPYAKKMTQLFQNLSAANQDGQSWYSQQRPEEKILLVVISSDRGLCGSFNSTIIKAAIKLMTENYAGQHAKKNVTILPLGKKAFEFFSKRNYKIVSDYWNIFHGLSYEGVALVGEYLMDAFKKGEYDKIEIVYNEFKNVATQILRTEQFLPVLPLKKQVKDAETDYIYLPNQEDIVVGLVPKALKIQLYKSVLDSNAAENGARMTAMDKATENAGELLKELKLTYNRTRQAAITKEILEIVAGAEALKAS
ncbi:MAG: ATP synthase F1 subunit gamma [Cyclobacteriaceae bacterium]|jgi:F-type H+-transporting ATPase subunit gamma|nr:ATP synthase F1 subunit gamma [Cyclobacteriaceae bacterium]